MSVVYTKDAKCMSGYKVGRHSYGVPTILATRGVKQKVEIGSFCSIAAGVLFLLSVEHRVDWFTTYPFNILWGVSIKGHPYSKGDIIVGNDVWIGQNVVVLSGVKVSDGACIGAGSVVTKDVPPYTIVVGNPARQVKTRFPPEIVSILLKLKWWDRPDNEIREILPVLMSGNVEALRRLK